MDPQRGVSSLLWVPNERTGSEPVLTDGPMTRSAPGVTRPSGQAQNEEGASLRRVRVARLAVQRWLDAARDA